MLCGADGGVAGPRAWRVALGLPVVAGVTELFRWVADGDRVLVDGDAGSVVVNPSRVDVAAHRKR